MLYSKRVDQPVLTRDESDDERKKDLQLLWLLCSTNEGQTRKLFYCHEPKFDEMINGSDRA